MSSSGISRIPPSSDRKSLREEVGFGCPVQGCGSPYLSWHHFDPPWKERKHHKVDGMIALCLQHHREADVGTYTKEQLHEMKVSPYLRSVDHWPMGRFNWRRDKLLVVAGSNFCLGTETILKVGGQRLIWLTKDDQGYEQMNLDIRRTDGSKILEMEDNDWSIHKNFNDLECPPSGNSLALRVHDEDISLDLIFKQVRKANLKSYIMLLSKRKAMVETSLANTGIDLDQLFKAPLEHAYQRICDEIDGDQVTLCKVKARLKWPLDLQLTEKRAQLLGLTLAGNFAINPGNTCFSVG